MSMYQPGIPTGTVNLDTDYQNIQDNFSQLDTTFGVDHTKVSDQTGQNGYHKNIHFIPNSNTTGFPPNNYPANAPTNTNGYGQLWTAQTNDGFNPDETLYFLTGGNRNIQLTRNIQPIADTNGLSFIPGPGTGAGTKFGAPILQWGTTVASNTNLAVSFPQAFPNNIFNIQVTRLHSATPPGTTFGFWVESSPTNISKTGFTIDNLDGHTWTYMWLAIGN